MRRFVLFLIAAIVSISPVYYYVQAKQNITTREIYVIQPYDTLWSIAASHYPQEDTRKVVWEIEQLNHIDNVIQVGQEIVLP